MERHGRNALEVAKFLASHNRVRRVFYPGLAGDSGRAIFPAFAAVNKIDASKIKWQTMEPAVTIPSLLSGAIDGTSLFYVSGPALWNSAKKEGKETSTLFYSDHGVDTYSIGLVTTDEYVRTKKDLVRRFVQATYRGAAWMVENPQGATDTYRKYHPATDPEIARQMVDITIDHMLTKTAEEKGLGYIDEKKMTYTRDLITKYMELPKVVPLSDIYTNEFLTPIFAKRKK
jgi:NitT/TauT family transport system substrate-binding protein